MSCSVSRADDEEERESLLAKEKDADADSSPEQKRFVHSITTDLLGADTGDRFDWIVESASFKEYPNALFCARFTYCFLVLVVLISLGVLFFYYCMGVVQIEREYYWYDQLKVPTLVICPDLGRLYEGFGSFALGRITRGRYPSAHGLNRTVRDYTEYACMDRLLCKCIDFGSSTFVKLEDGGNDLISVSFNATSASQVFFFGFNEPGADDMREVPQTYAYSLLGTRVLGYLELHLIDLREQKVSWSLRGGFHRIRDVRLYHWQIAGQSVPSQQHNSTELLFGFKTFQVARDQTFSALWSPFAILTVFLMGMSIFNNLNIFGLVFPVIQHPTFTQREPSLLLRGLCPFCPCWDKRPKRNRKHKTRLEELLAEHMEQTSGARRFSFQPSSPDSV